MAERRLADDALRRRALQPEASLIVQAPAGSGKTELLARRFLVLLAGVERPEEILAITFTRKAAGEMRLRILEALELARGKAPDQSHRQETWALGRAALARDHELGWQLLDNPRRLRVETIDALTAWLARQLPVSSGLGAAPMISEDPGSAYREAARRVLLTPGTTHPAAADAAALLAHLGNRFGQAEALLVALLERRDHWLGRLVDIRSSPNALRTSLEAAVARFVEDELRRVHERFGAARREAIGPLAAAAALRVEGDPDMAALAAAGGFPQPAADALAAWRGLCRMLLTSGGDWRKRPDRRHGFAPSDREAWDALCAGLVQLSTDPDLAGELARTARLPGPRYDEGQWRMLERLLALLPVCAAELELSFAARGETDYVGVARAALAALGPPGEPTDLVLALDHRIRHVLVDEFQDTSQVQLELLERLTAGWTPGDGRTLFCVGDPMQSIYRFREADVGRFLRVQQSGIGDVRLERLTLSVNFRSQAGLVEWVSGTFPAVFPRQEDLVLGAVAFAPSTSWHAALPGEAVHCQAVDPHDPRDEARQVRDRIARIRAAEPDARIAVLVRSRAHLTAIAPALAAAGLRFQAVDIQPLGRAPAVQDLIALTRALCHRADRVAWLAVLRAPWCGLALADLLAVAGADGDDVWERIGEPEVLARLGADGRARVQRLRETLAASVAERGRAPLARVVHGAWLALGGPACLVSPADLDDVRRFLQFLGGHSGAGDLDDPVALEADAAELYAAPDAGAGPGLQLLTIHKAKGLEFDHVILPGLHRTTRGEGKRLLRWLELERAGGADLILAPVESLGDERDALHRALAALDARREALETDRLLYVAVTRARRRLHLFAGVGADDPDTGASPAPPQGTLLARLWPALGELFLASRGPAPAASTATPPPPVLRRLPADWRLPRLSTPGRIVPGPELPGTAAVAYDWAGRESRAIGLAVHRMLQLVAREGTAAWPAARLESIRPLVDTLLAEAGLASRGRAAAVDACLNALAGTLADERGAWILDPRHANAASELSLSGRIDGQLVRGIVDRSFVADDGTLWIIDYKTGGHAGGGREEFLDREQLRYRAQMERYAALLGSRHEGPLRLGLYFPRLSGWREWAPPAGG